MFKQTKKYLNPIYFLSFGLIFSVILAKFGQSTVWANSPGLIAQEASSKIAEGVTQVNLFQAIVLGFVQGATEFIPISSTAHLKAVPVFLGWGDPGVSFIAVIQLGSVAAVLSYFWSDLTNITQGMIKAVRTSDYDSQDFWLAVGIAVGTIPIVILGLMLKVLEPAFYENTLRSMPSIAIVSIVMALLLALAESIGNQKRNFEDLTVKDGILVGLAQALAIIPGVSRSGSELKELIIPAEGTSFELLPLIGALISSAVFSYLAIAWLLEFLKRRSTWVFVWYRLGFGVFILAAVALGWVKG